jgi:hypothetical protein
MAFTMNKLAMINYCEIILEKFIFFALNHCEIQVHTILVCALYSIKYGAILDICDEIKVFNFLSAFLRLREGIFSGQRTSLVKIIKTFFIFPCYQNKLERLSVQHSTRDNGTRHHF